MSHFFFFLLGKGERLNEEKGGNGMRIMPAWQISNSLCESLFHKVPRFEAETIWDLRVFEKVSFLRGCN